MLLAVRTTVYGDRPPDELARAVAGAGFGAVQLDLDLWRFNLAEGGLTAALAGRIAEVFDREDIQIAALGIEADLVSGGPAAVDQLIAVLRVAPDFGTDLVVTPSGPGDDWTAVIDNLEDVLDEADSKEMTLAIDLRPEMAVRDLDQAELLLEAVESENLTLSMDVLQIAAASDVAPADVLERIGDALTVVRVDASDQVVDPNASPSHGGTELGALFDLLAQYAPDAALVADGLLEAQAAEARIYLARFL